MKKQIILCYMNSNKYLASANTTNGFVNLFSNIQTNSNGFTYILKGGPGTGKSSFMKSVGQYFEDKGFFVEYFYCSSDPTSLDGVKVKNIAIVDGTSPHACDPTIINAKEKIINVGENVSQNIKKDQKKIEKLLVKKSNQYKLAYSYLNALKHLIKTEEMLLLAHKSSQIVDNLTFEKSSKKQIKRTLFMSYFCDTKIQNLYSKNSYKNKIILKGNFLEHQGIFASLLEKLNSKNQSYTTFVSILDPEKIEAVSIPSSKTLIVSQNAIESNFVNFKNQKLLNMLTKLIAKSISKAISYHKKTETYFVKNMCFAGLHKQILETKKEMEEKF